ncbi:unnamed protein product, partial [Mesorhabditis spiculigera]
MKPETGKYHHLSCEIKDDLGKAFGELIEYANANIQGLTLKGTVEAQLMFELKCPEFSLDIKLPDDQPILPLLDKLLAEWKSGHRDIERISIYLLPLEERLVRAIRMEFHRSRNHAQNFHSQMRRDGRTEMRRADGEEIRICYEHDFDALNGFIITNTNHWY